MITERKEPFTLKEVFDFIDDTNISNSDVHELKSRIINLLLTEKEKTMNNFVKYCYINGIGFSYMQKTTDEEPFAKRIIDNFKKENMNSLEEQERE